MMRFDVVGIGGSWSLLPAVIFTQTYAARSRSRP